MRRSILVSALLAAALPLLCPGSGHAQYNPISAIYDAARDERSVGDIAADKKISTVIKADLAKKSAKLALSVKVYCYMRRVTLLGQLADEDFKSFAVATAKKTKGVKAVSTHWEAPAKSDTTAADVEIAAKLRAALIGDKNISATQIESEVFSGKVYLIGMVRSQKDIDRAVVIAKGVKGVTAVESLLIAPRSK